MECPQTSVDRGSTAIHRWQHMTRNSLSNRTDHCTESTASERISRSQVTENYMMGSECRIRHLQGNRIIVIHCKLINLPSMVMDIKWWWSFTWLKKILMACSWSPNNLGMQDVLTNTKSLPTVTRVEPGRALQNGQHFARQVFSIKTGSQLHIENQYRLK